LKEIGLLKSQEINAENNSSDEQVLLLIAENRK